MWVAREYPGVPLEFTENGAAYCDRPGPDGVVRHERRVDFIRGDLRAVGRAMREGAPIRAYHAWTLLDIFDWSEGFTQRFGWCRRVSGRGGGR